MSSFTNSPITMNRSGDSKVITSSDRPTKPGQSTPVVWQINQIVINAFNATLDKTHWNLSAVTPQATNPNASQATLTFEGDSTILNLRSPVALTLFISCDGRLTTLQDTLT